jgi:phage repressor protein C with HTH and peptisase S24 domain
MGQVSMELHGVEMAGRSDRLIQAREYAKYGSANAAALHFGWPASTYRAHENGSRKFRADDAHKYGAAFGVSPEWLLHGRGKMITEDTKPAPSALNALQRLESVVFPSRLLPVYGKALDGAKGALQLDTQVDQAESLPGLEHVPDAYAVYVVGDSMSPRYDSGDRVYVNPAREPRKGDCVVAQIRSEGEPAGTIGYIRQFVGNVEGQLVLAQLNPPETMTFDQAQVVAIHKIVGTRTD